MNSERLYEQGILFMQRKKEIVESVQEEKVRAELEDVFDYPEINYKSRIIIGERDPMHFHEYSTKWLEDRNRRLEDSRQTELDKERSFSPIKRSDTPKGYQSIITDWESRVTSYYEKKNKNNDIYSHTPEINSNSRAMLPFHTEPVEERLIKYQLEKQDKIKELKKRIDSENVPSFRPMTNNCTKARPEDVNEFLYLEGVQMIEKRKKAAELCINGNFSFKPAINENSKALAGNRKPKVKVEVVPEPVQPSRVLKPEEFSSFLERNYKKVQKVRDESPEVQQKKPLALPISSSLYEKEMKRILLKEQKRNEILRAREMDELNGCTFRPKLENRIKTPPPMMRPEKDSKVSNKYQKGPKSTVEYLRYEDKNHKIFQLKAHYHIDRGLFTLIEDLEKKVEAYLDQESC